MAKIFVKAGEGRGTASFRAKSSCRWAGRTAVTAAAAARLLAGRSRISPLDALSLSNPTFAPTTARMQVAARKCTARMATIFSSLLPPGTVVFDDETGEPMADLIEPAKTFHGRQGGAGRARQQHFMSSTRQAPRMAELGEPGEERWIRLELKLIADVGLVGFPNAGKSTLLAASSAAAPKIADYPFTTLEPNLGVVQFGPRGGETFVMADIPGLDRRRGRGCGAGL